MESHGTIVIGWDDSGEVKFCKTFSDDDREGAHAAFDYVRTNYPTNYLMSDTGHLLHTKNFKEGHI